MKENNMYSPVNADRPGLCISCNNASDCVYRNQRGFDAFYCEMFDCFPITASDDDGRRDNEPHISNINSLSEEMNQIEAKGLCSNCDNFKNCFLPKPEEGVWHCEEYR